jgi:hypothetical protein
MKTLIVNLKHAARNWDTVVVGGGCFSPLEILAALEQLDALQRAARKASEAMQGGVGGEPLPTLAVEAIAALELALKPFEEPTP